MRITAAAHSFIWACKRTQSLSALFNSVFRISLQTSLCRNCHNCFLVNENEVLSGRVFNRVPLVLSASFLACTSAIKHKAVEPGICKRELLIESWCYPGVIWLWVQLFWVQGKMELYLCLPSCGNWFWESSKNENWDLTTVESGLKSKAMIPSLRNRSRINGIMNSWFI